MRRLIDRCAGIDAGHALLVVCVRVVDEKGRLNQQVRSLWSHDPVCRRSPLSLSATDLPPRFAADRAKRSGQAGAIVVTVPAEPRYLSAPFSM
jgi:hypothetical protein